MNPPAPSSPQSPALNGGLLDYPGVAARLNVTVRQARELVARKYLRPVKLGHRTIRFRPADVDRCVARRAGDADTLGRDGRFA